MISDVRSADNRPQLAVFVSAYSFMGAMTFFCYCKPMSAFWDHSIKDATCYSIHLFITFALINTCAYFA